MLSLSVNDNKWNKVCNALITELSNLENTCNKLVVDVFLKKFFPLTFRDKANEAQRYEGTCPRYTQLVRVGWGPKFHVSFFWDIPSLTAYIAWSCPRSEYPFCYLPALWPGAKPCYLSFLSNCATANKITGHKLKGLSLTLEVTNFPDI